MKSTLNDALRRAWENYTENGTFTKVNPAICRDGKGFYFGSALNGDQVVFDLSEITFGPYSPDGYESAEDFAADLEPVVATGGDLLPPSVASLSEAIRAMKAQADELGNRRLNIMPQYLVDDDLME